MDSRNDIYYMRKAIALAAKATGSTSPNPLVGAVVVKGDEVIANGYHKECGKPHAEVIAFKKSKTTLKGATLYVNLEPCYHYGRTPPCVDLVIKEGIKRVVIATLDPNPLVRGKSIKKLKKAGISVTIGVAKEEAMKLNEIFFTNMISKKPFIVAKVAQTLDGKIATKKGISKWITSVESRKFSRGLRDKYDCVLVGANTVVKDDPQLDGLKRSMFKVIIDPSLKTPINCQLLKKTPEKTIIFTSDKNISKARIFSSDVNILFMKTKDGNIPVKDIVRKLYKVGIKSIFVEGGADTLGRFFKEKLVDKAYFFIAPKVMGGHDSLGSIGFQGPDSLLKCLELDQVKVERIDSDILIWGYPKIK